MPDKTFLEQYSLYRRFPFPDAHRTTASHKCPAIQRHCGHCGNERTYIEKREWRHEIDPHGKLAVHPFSGAKTSLVDCYVFYSLVCSDCLSDFAVYIVYFGTGTETLFNPPVEELERGGYVMKVGQHPPWSIDTPKEVNATLGEYAPLYKKGSICESQGYGIGAFAYYRRIIEGVIDKLLQDVSDLLEPAERQKYSAALAQVESSKVAQDKIAVVKDLLPSSLRPGGVNPLAILHDALSAGIHALDEDDCLALADDVRTSLAMLAKHIALAKEDKDRYSNGITGVKERLDKIKARAKRSE